MTYLPCNSQSHADNLSAALWDLARPPAMRTPDEVTRYYSARVRDNLGNWWLEIPDDFDLDVSPLASEIDFTNAVAQIELAEDAP